MGLRNTVLRVIVNPKFITGSSIRYKIATRHCSRNNQRNLSMTPLKIFATLKVAAVCLVAVAAHAHEYYTATFKIIHPWAEATAAGTSIAPVYLKFEEITGSDKLVAARSDIAGKVELRSKLDNDSTAEVSAILPAIEVTAGSTTELHAGGVHLVMIGLKTPLQWGRSYPLTLIFEKAGAIDTMLSVGSH